MIGSGGKSGMAVVGVLGVVCFLYIERGYFVSHVAGRYTDRNVF